MRRTRLTWALLMLILSLPMTGKAHGMVIRPPAGSIPDTKLHDLFTNGLDTTPPPFTGTTRTLPSGTSDDWKGTGELNYPITNKSTVAWTGFHVRSKGTADLNLDVSIGGFGVRSSPRNVDLNGNPSISQATLFPDAKMKPVPAGTGVMGLKATVQNFTLFNVTYNLQVQPLSKAPPAPAPMKTNQGKSDGSELIFAAADRHLSFTGHRMADTGFPNDPILMANVNIPAFVLAGIMDDGNYIFGNETDDLFTISASSGVFFQADISNLTYLPSDNSFYGELFDFQFPGMQSPWISEMANLFGPSSADPDLRLYFTYTPGGNLLELTQGFSVDQVILNGTDSIFAGHAVPGPSTLTLFGIGSLTMFGFYRLRRKRNGRAGKRDRLSTTLAPTSHLKTSCQSSLPSRNLADQLHRYQATHACSAPRNQAT